jgi:hypothetical protein
VRAARLFLGALHAQAVLQVDHTVGFILHANRARNNESMDEGWNNTYQQPTRKEKPERGLLTAAVLEK